MNKLEDLKSGVIVKGISSEGPVNVKSVEWHGSDIISLVYKDITGGIKEQIFGRDIRP